MNSAGTIPAACIQRGAPATCSPAARPIELAVNQRSVESGICCSALVVPRAPAPVARAVSGTRPIAVARPSRARPRSRVPVSSSSPASDQTQAVARADRWPARAACPGDRARRGRSPMPRSRCPARAGDRRRCLPRASGSRHRAHPTPRGSPRDRPGPGTQGHAGTPRCVWSTSAMHSASLVVTGGSNGMSSGSPSLPTSAEHQGPPPSAVDHALDEHRGDGHEDHEEGQDAGRRGGPRVNHADRGPGSAGRSSA